MKKINLFLVGLALSSAVVVTACNETAKNETEETTELSTIKVNPVADSKQFPGAELKVSSITAEKVGADSALLTVRYEVMNFTLTEHTDDPNSGHMANSAEGQHIHFILDNTPYAALYKPEHTVMVKLNTDHNLMSFLSRSYHESIKEPTAAVLKHFTVNEEGEVIELESPNEPALFYSRPKGEYAGEDTDKILLDFYLANTTLDDGYKVEAKVNGETFVLDEWVPYEIEGAPKGDLTVQLTLLDKEGKAMEGENKSITRKTTLEE